VGVLLAGAAVGALNATSAWADTNLAANKPTTGSAPCRPDENAAKATNGSRSRGLSDKWCSLAAGPQFLQVDLGARAEIARFVVRHAGAGGEPASWNTRAFDIQVSEDGTNFRTLVKVDSNTKDVTEHRVAPTPARHLRLNVTKPVQSGGPAARIYEFEAYGTTGANPPPASASPTSPAPGKPPAPSAVDCHPSAPPEIQDDYVAQHTDRMTRVACNSEVALYFDDSLKALPPSRTQWVAPFVSEVWKHYRETYGRCAVERNLPAPVGPGCAQFGQPKPLMAFFHEGKNHGGTVANRFDESSGFRNTIDVGDNGWNQDNATLRDVITHEACHIVEGSAHGVHESPAFPVWGDSKWAEICQFDFYQRTGRAADAKRVFDKFSNGRDQLPKGATNASWFKDWFHPLWVESGQNPAFMDRFFGLLSQHFPKRAENGGRNEIYARRMNAGEFVHFMSGAMGRDLSDMAGRAFNSGFKRAEFDQARRDFPGIRY
jgi:hypothetical protein